MKSTLKIFSIQKQWSYIGSQTPCRSKWNLPPYKISWSVLFIEKSENQVIFPDKITYQIILAVLKNFFLSLKWNLVVYNHGYYNKETSTFVIPTPIFKYIHLILFGPASIEPRLIFFNIFNSKKKGSFFIKV